MSFAACETEFPDSESTDLDLDHPTLEEQEKIWTDTFSAWGDALTLPIYLEESLYLTTVPLAKDGGMTTWILTNKRLSPNERPIYCSCESFRKRALTATAQGEVKNVIVHGIASVFCPPTYRRRGYAARMLKKLAKVLPQWQSEDTLCIGSVLYSDIGKRYYRELGWHPNITNTHVEFTPARIAWPYLAKPVHANDIDDLCRKDEEMIRTTMALPNETPTLRMSILPAVEHMSWHIGKEKFGAKFLFGKEPQAKGAIAGPLGNRLWVIWTHRYYYHPDHQNPHNVLYILRFVVEDEGNVGANPRDTDTEETQRRYKEQKEAFTAIIQAAQHEAAEWKLQHIKWWSPTPLLSRLLKDSGIEHSVVEREDDSVASGLWFDDKGELATAPIWLNNEHYAWC